MWTCPQCGTQVEPPLTVCRNCGTSATDSPAPDAAASFTATPAPPIRLEMADAPAPATAPAPPMPLPVPPVREETVRDRVIALAIKGAALGLMLGAFIAVSMWMAFSFIGI